MPPTSTGIRHESHVASPPTASQVRVLAEVPWLGAAPPAAPPTPTIASRPTFNLAPQTLLASADQQVEQQPTSQPLWRLDAGRAAVAQPTIARRSPPQPVAAAVSQPVHVIAAHDARPIPTPVAAANREAPWGESLIVLHSAILPYARVLLLLAALMAAGVVLLMLRGIDNGAAPIPHDLAPLANRDHVPPLTSYEPSTDEVAAAPTDASRPLVALEPMPGRRPAASGPAIIARRPVIDSASTMSSPVLVPYPSTSQPESYRPIATDASTGERSPVEARLAERILPLTEQAQHDQHQSSLH